MMTTTKILLTLLLSITFLNASSYEVKSFDIASEQNIHLQKEKELNTGIALDIKANKSDSITFTVAYEGDYMIINDYLEEEKQIINNNYYLGINYKF